MSAVKFTFDEQVDQHFMSMALNMARRGLGTTAPNPSVGAVIVNEFGVILGRGWTQPGGRPHAEVDALDRAGTAAKGATLYVTLEPCSHHGQSPPCSDAVIRAGIRRVVCGVRDPNELVAGQGFAKLRAAGIEVVENILRDEAHWMTLGHISKIGKDRPFVQLKIATGGDGLIAPGEGVPIWVTGMESRATGHLMRAQADIILVGIGTVLADNPSLDCRLPGLEDQSPDIIVLDNFCRLPLNARLLEGDRSVTVAATMRVQEAADLSARGVHVWMQNEYDEVPLGALMESLAERGYTRLLVEGGPHVWRSFLDAGLVDEIVHFKGAQEVGSTGILPLVDAGIERITGDDSFEEVDQRAIGADKMITYRNKNSMKAN